MYFDSHFHLASVLLKQPDYTLPENLIGLDVAIETGDLRSRLEKAMRFSSNDIFFSSGAGPWALESKDFKSAEDEISKIEREITKYGADAIGEAGFDKHWDYGTTEAQRELFYAQIELAVKYDRALIIHSRDADDELCKAIPRLGPRAIFHCYSSDKEIMYKALDKGAYISFSANISYKGSDRNREAARLCPADRLLYETDSPFLAPRTGERRINTPERSEFTLSFLSELRGEDPDMIKEHAIENFYSVLGYRKSKVKRDILAI